MRIRQHYRYDCGAACLAYICAYNGAHYTLAELSLYCGCNKEGISIKGIIDGAQKVGLDAKGYNSPNKEISLLKEIGSPFIAHTKNGEGYYHYVVVCSISEKQVKIMDPQYGTHKKISYLEFNSIWTGYIIICTPNAAFVKKEKNCSTAYKLLALSVFHKKECLLSFLGAVCCILIGICTSVFLQTFVDKAIDSNSHIYLKMVSILIVMLSTMSMVIGYYATIFLIQCSIKIDTTLVSEFLEKLFVLPSQFFHSHPIGDITSRMDDIVKVRSFVTTGITSTLTALLTLAGSVIFMFFFNAKLGCAIICFVPIYILIYYLSGKVNKKLGKKLAVCNAEFEAGIIENISGITTIKHYNCQKIALDRLGRSFVEYAGAFYRSANAINKYESATTGIGVGIIATVFTLATHSIINNLLTIGEFVGLYTLCTFFTTPLNRLMETGEIVANAVVAFERLQEILDLKDEKGDDHTNYLNLIPCNIEKSTIEFCKVNFSYPGRDKLLHNLNFTISPGEVTLISGTNGCGKSTVASLICKDLEPTDGKITIGGTNLSTISFDCWRNIIGYIEQSPYLFNSTILENITCKEGTENIDKVLNICYKVGLLPLIEKLPMGLLTKVGNNGNALSGGECKKICIARAIYKNPQIYIFDEPDAHLDIKSRKEIGNIIKELKNQNKHIVLISHNMEGFELANKTIVIESNCSSGNLPCTDSAG